MSQLEAGTDPLILDGKSYFFDQGTLKNNPDIGLVAFGRDERGNPVVYKKFYSSMMAYRARCAAALMEQFHFPSVSIRSPKIFYYDDDSQIIEYRDGVDVTYLIQQGIGSTLEEIAKLLAAYAHSIHILKDAGFVQADIKIDNLLYEGDLSSTIDPTPQNTCVIDNALLTRANSVQVGGLVGTPLYLPPEYIVTGKYYSSHDLYSLGIVGFEQLMPGKLDVYLTNDYDNPVSTTTTTTTNGIQRETNLMLISRIMKAKVTGTFFRPDARQRIEEQYAPVIHTQQEKDKLRGILDFAFACTNPDLSARPKTLPESLQMLDVPHINSISPSSTL